MRSPLPKYTRTGILSYISVFRYGVYSSGGILANGVSRLIVVRNLAFMGVVWAFLFARDPLFLSCPVFCPCLAPFSSFSVCQGVQCLVGCANGKGVKLGSLKKLRAQVGRSSVFLCGGGCGESGRCVSLLIKRARGARKAT